MEKGYSIHMNPRIENGKAEHSITVQILDMITKEVQMPQEEGEPTLTEITTFDWGNLSNKVNFKKIKPETMQEIVNFAMVKLAEVK